MLTIESIEGPHQNASLYTSDTKSPTQALILVHGRGASYESILPLAAGVSPETLVLAPQANNLTWYPERFLVPQADNEPHLSSALACLTTIVDIAKEKNLTEAEIVLAGFSQGACLVGEYVKRNPTRYKGVAILSGGLIGTDEEVAHNLGGDLAETPIYIGCDENDPHIPLSRVHATFEYLKSHGALVDEQIYQGLGHTVHPDAFQFLSSTKI